MDGGDTSWPVISYESCCALYVLWHQAQRLMGTRAVRLHPLRASQKAVGVFCDTPCLERPLLPIQGRLLLCRSLEWAMRFSSDPVTP